MLLGTGGALVCCRVNYDELPETQLNIQSAGETNTGTDAGANGTSGGSSSSGGSSAGGSTMSGGSNSQQGGAASDAGAGEPGSAGAAESGAGSGGTSGGGSAGSTGAGGSSGSGGTSGGSGGGAGTCTPATYGGHDYLACTSPKSFVNAAVDCATRGYRPVRIDSAAEQTFVHDTIPIADQNNNNTSLWRWLGGNAQGVSGDWQWSDGTQFWTGGKGGSAVNGAYTNWANSQPGVNQVCLSMEARVGTWYAMDCTAAKPYVCEKY